MHYRTRTTWKNTTGLFTAHPLRHYEPESLHDLQTIVREAETKRLRVKAVGSGHSYSDVAVPRDYLVDLSRLKKFLLLNQQWLKPDWKKARLVQVEGGITIREMNRTLDEMGSAVVNMGGIDHQTIAGAISTGTHGTGVALPAITGMVRSIVLVAAGGEAYRIEPANGITDPTTYQEQGVTLLQDDSLFYSVLVSLGCMGIIYALVLEVRPMYWIRETKQLTCWTQVRKKISDGSIFQGNRGVMVQVNPYQMEGDHTCIVVTHTEVEEPGKRGLSKATRNLLSSVLGKTPVVPSITLFMVQRFPKRIPSILESSLKSLKDKYYLNKAHRVLYQGLDRIKDKAYDCEFAFDLKAPQPNYLEVTEQIFNVAENLRRKHDMYQTSPLGLRFVQQSPAYLAPEHTCDVCYIDTPVLVKAKGAATILKHYQELMLAGGGRPHWGKTNTILQGRASLIPELFPGFATWQQAYFRFNPHGTFDNQFSDRLQFGSLSLTV
jgi:hypothetical protein